MRTTRERRNYLGGEDDEGQRRPTDQGDAWPCGILLLRHLHATDLAVSTEVGGAQPRKRHAAGSRVLTQTCRTRRTRPWRRERVEDSFPCGVRAGRTSSPEAACARGGPRTRRRERAEDPIPCGRERRTSSPAAARERRTPSPAARERRTQVRRSSWWGVVAAGEERK